MIIIKLTGGLGNQLFQYVKGKVIAKENNTNLLLDISWYKGRLNRSFMLDRFNIKSKTATWLNTAFIKLANRDNYIETDSNNDWQSEKYLNKIEKEIREEFTLKDKLSSKNEEILKKIKSVNAISIHLRGTDYIKGNKSGLHNVCTKEYYSDAIRHISSMVTAPHYFIFTDDIVWAKDFIDFPESHTIVSDPQNPPEQEMILMSECKHNIIANSTFSWWGAWLNKNVNKIVIAPRKWFNNSSFESSSLIPQTWIKI